MTQTPQNSGEPERRVVYALRPFSLGIALIASSARGLCALFLGDAPQALTRALKERFPQAEPAREDEAFESLARRVLASLEAPGAKWAVPLDLEGTPFQRSVWRALCEIPPGATASYGDIAARIGHPSAARAVAGACAANNIAVAIPCHRVLRGDGALSGYRWGPERKRELLRREAAA